MGRMGELARAKEPAPAERTPERFGKPSEARPQGTLLWLHARRTEDTGVIHGLVHALSELRDEPVHALVTTADASGSSASDPGAVIHQLAPSDTVGSVGRFLDHWSPDAGVILGAPDRPVLINEAHDRGCPLFLAAPRRGEAAAPGRLGLLPASLIGVFDLCLAPSAAEAEALRKHTKPDRVIVTGPLTDTAVALPCNERLRDKLAKTLGGRPVWLAAGANDADLIAVEQAHRRAIRAAHRLLLIVALADTGAGAKTAAWFENLGWRTATRSSGAMPDEDVQIYIADAPDEMGLWYRLAPITFIAATFGGVGKPVDPFGPAALGSAIVHGPDIGAGATRFARLAATGAARALSDPHDLGDVIYSLLSPDKAAALAHAGWLATTESAHVIESLAERMDDALSLRGGI